MLRFVLAWTPLPSVTRTVKDAAPAVAGVPAIEPVPLFMLMPAGKLPLAIDQFSGGAPPVAAIAAEYDAPAVVAVNELVVIAGAA